MILLLTCDGDISCDLVIDWLNQYKQKYIRINSLDFLTNKIEIINHDKSFQIKFNDILFPIEEINVVWYRKFGFFEGFNFYHEASQIYNKEILNHISKEFNKVLSFFLLLLKDKRWISNPFKMNLNKMDVLRLAEDCNLYIPKTSIINRIDSLENEGDLIVKSVADSIVPSFSGFRYEMFTNQITENDKRNISQTFLPSLVQEKIEKKYEVRIFYLMGICYSMIIYSQTDAQTKLDFRKYNWVKPNRILPYKLPKEECVKINKLMRKIGLNCGSIDMIKATNDRYYFLEINPTGQFGMVDFPCNYGLHQKIAKKLIILNHN